MQELNRTSREIIELLRKSDGGMSAGELSRALGVTPMAVHRPLTALQNQGLVLPEVSRRNARGRPVRIYRLTASADERFPKNYGELLMELLEDLASREGASRVRKFFEARFRKLRLAILGKLKGKDLRSRIPVLSGILSQHDYMPESRALNGNKFMIRLHNCPISRVAREYPQACACEQRFLSEVLDAKIRRTHHILKGENYCCYSIEKK